MVIYGIDNRKIIDVPLTEGAEHEQELSKSDLVRLSWQGNIRVALPAGVYVVPFDDGLKYRLLNPYVPIEDDKGFKYAPEFHHPLMWLSRVPFLYDTTDENGMPIRQQEWSFDGLTSSALEHACKAINDALGIVDKAKQFTYTICGNVDSSVSFSVSSNDILSVLSSIAQACKGNPCEWHLSWVDKALYFGQISVNLGESVPLLKVHDNVQHASISENRDGYYNCFYPQGSTKNMSRKALVGTGNVATLARLGLDRTQYPDGCIYVGENGDIITKEQFNSSNFVKQTLALSFDDVYPRINLYAYNIRKRVRYLKREGTNEIEKDSQGNKKTYTIWYMRLAYPTTDRDMSKTPVNTTTENVNGVSTTYYWYDYEVDEKKQVLQGHTLKAVFKINAHTTNNQYDALSQSLVGQPNGQDGFELDYHEEGSHSIPPNADEGDSGVSIMKGDFEILKYQSGDVIIPTNENEGLYPRGKDKPDFTCNIVVLFNIVMGEQEVKAAQKELAERTIKEINRRMQDNSNYSFASNPIAFAKRNPNLYIGQKVTFDDGQGYQFSTRVIKLVTKLDYPIIQEITVGNQSAKGTISQLKEDVNNILSGNFSGGGLNATQVSNIVRNYTDIRFLRKDIPDTAEGLITFNKGAKTPKHFNVGDFVPGVSGATLAQYQGYTYLEVDKAYIRQKAIFNSLDIMKITYSFGNRVVGKGGVKITKVTPSANGYMCYFLAESDGIKVRNPFIVNDLAICQEFNVSQGTTEHATNHFYWRKVVRVGENWVELSKSICASGSDIPLQGDDLCQLGYMGTDNPDRQCAIMERTSGENVPSYVMLQGIDNFTLEGKDVISYGWDNAKDRAYMKTYGESFIGDRNRTEYVEYTPENGLEVKAKKIKIVSNGNATDVGDGIRNANQGVSNLAQRVTSVEVKANGIELKVERQKIGGTNLLKGSAFDILANVTTYLTELVKEGDKRHGKRNCVKVNSLGHTNEQFAGTRFSIPALPDTEYTASVWLMSDNIASIDLGVFSEIIYRKGTTRLRWWSTVKHELSSNEKWQRVSFTFTTPNDLDFDNMEFNTWVKRNGVLYISEPQLEKGNVVTDWSENPEDIKEGLVKTGIDITEGKVKMTADNFEIVNPKTNETSAMIDGDGKIDAKHIAAKKVWSEIVETGEIDAQNAKFKNMQVESGRIGGFNVKDNILTNENNGLTAIIAIKNKLLGNTLFLGDGFAPSTGLRAAASIMQEASEMYSLMSVGLHVGAKGGTQYNHAIWMPEGNIRGFRRYTTDMGQDRVLEKDECVLHALWENTISLPKDPEHGQEYEFWVFSKCWINSNHAKIRHMQNTQGFVTVVERNQLDLDSFRGVIKMSYNKPNNVWLCDYLKK